MFCRASANSFRRWSSPGGVFETAERAGMVVQLKLEVAQADGQFDRIGIVLMRLGQGFAGGGEIVAGIGGVGLRQKFFRANF